jgi:predicted RNase H-like HicB family nuclease
MDAKELHDLYATLWARVPEMRPRRVINDRTDLLTWHDEGEHRQWWEWNSTDPVDFDSAAALCRVAVEEWLIANSSCLHEFSFGNEFRVGAGPILSPLSGDYHEASGPTIHHALVSAAHALQDVLAASQGKLDARVVLTSGEDGQWVASVPSMPGCISQGKTPEEALENVREATALWAETVIGDRA